MRWLVRAMFAVLLMLTLLTQAGRLAAHDASDGGRGVSGQATMPGLAALPQGGPAAAAEGTRWAMAAGCSAPVMMARVGFNGAGLETLTAMPAAPTERRYVYLGQVRTRLDTVPMMVRWAAASGLHAIGLRRDPAPRDAVLIAWPRACPALAAWDWSRLSPWR